MGAIVKVEEGAVFMILVTVVIPAYNMENYIAHSIESVIAQSEKNWELIVVNDGSTDQTEAVVRSYIVKDSRIQLITQDNQGVSVARNRGLSVAKGKYITFLDADDWYDPHYLKKMIAPLDDDLADMVLCRYQEVDLTGAVYSQSPKEIKKLIDNSLIKHLLSVRNTHANMAMIYRLSLLKAHKITFLEGCANGEDRLFVLKASYYARVTFLPEYLYFYLYRTDSACRATISYDRYFKKLAGYQSLYEFFQQQLSTVQSPLPFNTDIPSYLLYIDQEIMSIHNDLRRQMWQDLKAHNFDLVSNTLMEYQRQFKRPFTTHERGFKRITNFAKIKIIQSNHQLLWRVIFRILTFNKKNR